MYIGQTINEKDRRKHFLIQKLSYGGIKIDTARAKYNPENFKYEILETRFYMTKKAAVEVGTDTVQRSLYNPLCPCSGFSNSILFDAATPAA